MKRFLLIIFCLILVGCGSKEEVKEENKEKNSLHGVIDIEHKTYMNWFNEYISKETDKYNVYESDERYDITYSYKDVSVMESYISKTQKLYSYFIVASDTNINSLVSLVIYHNCNVTFDKIDELLEKEEDFGTYGSCRISKYITSSGVSYSINV